MKANGEFPGEYMSTPDGNWLLQRVQFGNIVLLPQNAAGSGTNAFQIVHGTNAAPPHTYIASYLWTQYGLKPMCSFISVHTAASNLLQRKPVCPK